MVIAAGIGRNAYIRQRYLWACIAGFAAQAAVAYGLWRAGAPRMLHGAVWAISASLLLLLFMAVLAALIKRPSLLCASSADGAQNRQANLAPVAFEAFAKYLLAYCLCAQCLPRWSTADFACAEAIWLVLFVLAPTLAQSPGVRQKSQASPVYPLHALGLWVARADGETILLAPETVAQSDIRRGRLEN